MTEQPWSPELMRDIESAVRRQLTGKNVTRADRDEALQIVFVRLLESIRNHARIDDPVAYASGIAENVLKETFRRQDVHRRHRNAVAHSRAKSGTEASTDAELREAVFDAVGRLTLLEQEVCRLRFSGLNYDEIARLINAASSLRPSKDLSASATRAHMQRILAKLQAELIDAADQRPLAREYLRRRGSGGR